MSHRTGPTRLLKQLCLDGTVDLIELHGLGGRTRANTLHLKSLAHANAEAASRGPFLAGRLRRPRKPKSYKPHI